MTGRRILLVILALVVLAGIGTLPSDLADASRTSATTRDRHALSVCRNVFRRKVAEMQ